jgi:uncharacterized membrane protein YcaP (DUF421 family)
MTSLGLHIVKHRYRNSMKEVQTLPGADTVSVHNLLVAKISTRLKKIIRLIKGKPKWYLEKFCIQRHEGA